MDIQKQILLDMKKRHEDNAKAKKVRKSRKPVAKAVSDTEEKKEARE